MRDSFNGALLRVIDGLADPARRRRAALVFCLGYGALWFIYGVIAKSSQDLNADMAEMIVWTRELALGYPKHPPLLAWVLWAWFKIFPLADWAYLLLAVVTVSAGIFLAIELCAEWLAREKLAAVPFLLAAIPFYNFLGLKLDQNSVLIPLWALAMWAMLRALDTRHLGWAALAGIAAAAAMLTKYWSAFLIVALALAALFHLKRARLFPLRCAVGDGGRFLSPRSRRMSAWLIREDFPPITWVATRRVALSFCRYARLDGRVSRRHRRLCGGRDRAGADIRSAGASGACRWPLPRDERRIAGDPVLDAAPAADRSGADQEHQPALALEHARAQSAAGDAAWLAAGRRAAHRGAAHRQRGDGSDAADRCGVALRGLRAAQKRRGEQRALCAPADGCDASASGEQATDKPLQA